MDKHENYLVLWGGTDINSEIYGAKRLKYAQQPDTFRDLGEEAAIDDAIAKGLPIIGICRGAQFICAKAGGSLYQHSIGHNQSHDVLVRNLGPNPKGEWHFIDSPAAGHHQIMNPTETNHIIYGVGQVKTEVWTSDEEHENLDFQPEIVYFPKINALAIQPHTEWMSINHPFNVYINQLIKQLFNLDINPHTMEIEDEQT